MTQCSCQLTKIQNKTNMQLAKFKNDHTFDENYEICCIYISLFRIFSVLLHRWYLWEDILADFNFNIFAPCIYQAGIIHWNRNAVIWILKNPSLAALEIVILTNFSAANDDNFIKIMTFQFQCSLCWNIYPYTWKFIWDTYMYCNSHSEPVSSACHMIIWINHAIIITIFLEWLMCHFAQYTLVL